MEIYIKRKGGDTKMSEEKRNYNETHPELRAGEMFIGNFMSDEYSGIGWSTKRTGRQAYTIHGEEQTGFMPVFVQRSEYEEGTKK